MVNSDILQTRINFYTNLFALFANIIVGIYYTPYLVNNLGLSAYGVLPLALVINQYIGVATSTFTHTFTRFYSIALQKGDNIEASKDLSTSLIVVFFIILISTPFCIALVYNVESLFCIPKGLEQCSKFLFIFTISSFFCSLLSSMLNVTLYAINRLDIMNYMKIVRITCKLLFVIFFFEIVRIDISFVGLANIMTELIILIASTILFFHYKPLNVRISKNYFSRNVMYSILGMSIWMLLQTCGDTFLYRTDNLIVNHFWGSISSGALGAVSEIGTYTSIIVSVIGSLYGPLVLKAYAKGNHDEVKFLFVTQSTIVGCISAILVGILSGSSSDLLDIWLGKGMGTYSLWLCLKLIVLPFYAAGGILAFVYRSWNRMKFPAIGTLILGGSNLIIMSLIGISFKNAQPTHVLIVGVIFSISQCFFLGAITVCKIYEKMHLKFVSILSKIVMTYVVGFTISYVCSYYYDTNSLMELGTQFVIIGLFMALFVCYVVLSKTERLQLFSIIK